MARIARVERFIEKIQGCRTQDEIKAICDQEVAYLRSHLKITWGTAEDGKPCVRTGNPATLSTQLQPYRRAVETLPLTDWNYSTKWVRGDEVRSHVALKHLTLTWFEREFKKESHVNQLRRDMENLRPVDPSAFIARGLDQLKSDSYLKIASGLAALTGRRMTEVLKTARLEPTENENEYEAVFYGQLKTKGSSDIAEVGYVIPLLAPYSVVSEALDRLRTLKDFSGLSNDQVHDRCRKSLDTVVKRDFDAVISQPKFKDLRSAYVRIAYHLYAPKTIQDKVYFSKVLGHSNDDVATSDSYLDFYVA